MFRYRIYLIDKEFLGNLIQRNAVFVGESDLLR